MWSSGRGGSVSRSFVDCYGVAVLFLGLVCCYGSGPGKVDSVATKAKVEYVRLPLMTYKLEDSSDVWTSKPTQRSFLPKGISPYLDGGGGNTTGLGQRRSATIEKVGGGGEGVVIQRSAVNNISLNISELLNNLTGTSEEEDDAFEEEIAVEEEGDQEANDEKGATGSDIKEEQENGGEHEDEDGDDDDEIQFNEMDLIELVQDLEHQADVEEQTGIFPEILDILHGKQQHKRNATDSSTSSTQTPFSNITSYKTGIVTRSNGTLRISLNEEGDLQLGSEDLSQFSEEIVEGISDGVEESLRMSDDLILDEDIIPSTNLSAENRQFSVYIFQGQYYSEPRLNRFIDGALQNMGTELRVSSMDPLFFRVLPRGHVAEKDPPLLSSGPGGGVGGIRRRRPSGGRVGRHVRVEKQFPAFFRLQPKRTNPQQQTKQFIRLGGQGQGRKNPTRLRKNRVKKKRIPAGITKITSFGGTNLFLKRKRQNQRLQRERKRRQRLRLQKLRQQLKNRLKKQQQKKNQNKKQQQNQVLLNRIRRRIRQDVGGGRIEGLSRVQRDGDAEMQTFGNYTLIRSHMKMGPVEITMQFRTKNGIRRSGATLPAIRAHTVTRVNHEGSEMIDYLLDRPHPESIRVRGSLFPLAQKVARNIFSRLFLPNSFLVSRLREKASLAFLSRPVVAK